MLAWGVGVGTGVGDGVRLNAGDGVGIGVVTVTLWRTTASPIPKKRKGARLRSPRPSPSFGLCPLQIADVPPLLWCPAERTALLVCLLLFVSESDKGIMGNHVANAENLIFNENANRRRVEESA